MRIENGEWRNGRVEIFNSSFEITRSGSISVVLLVSLVVLLSGSAIIATSVNGKFFERKNYERIANRYVAESGVELAVGLFENHLEKQDFVMTYTRNADGSFSVIDDFSPYLLDEIRQGANGESVFIDQVSTESADLLASIGFLEFRRTNGIQLLVNTFSRKDSFKLSQLCIEPDFSVSFGGESGFVRSKVNSIYLTVKSLYKGGEVLCSVELSNLYMVREPFAPCGIGELSAVSAWIDASDAVITYVTYQNYKRSEF